MIRILILLVTLLLGACDGERPISVATHTWVGYEPLFLAKAMGWLTDSKVALVHTPGASESVQALRDGRVDGAALTLDEVLRARAQGIPLTIVLVLDVSVGADAVLARPVGSGLHSLRGQRIGYLRGTVSDLVLMSALEQAGFKPTDVRPVNLSPEELEQAWSRQDIDAAVAWEPYVSRLKTMGGNVIFDSRSMPNMIVDVLAFRSDRLNRGNRATVEHLVEAQFRALRHIEESPQDASYRMAGRMGIPVDAVAASFRGLLMPDAAANRGLLVGPRATLNTSVVRLRKILGQRALLSKADGVYDDGVAVEIIDGSYLPGANVR